MPITRKKIIESIHAGARAANEKYTEWSKGLWLYDSGVESLLVCEIAEQLYQSQSNTERLWLELSVGKILDIFKVPIPQEANEHQRVDIALLNRNRQPTFIIEVKRDWNNRFVRNDLDKIRSLVQNCPLTCGFLAVFMAHQLVYRDMREKIKERIEFVEDYGVENNIGVGVKADKIHKAESEDGRLWEWSSLSIEMSTRRRIPPGRRAGRRRRQ